MSNKGIFKNLFFKNKEVDSELIFTIDREYGSCGDEISNIISKKLNIPVYDEKIIELKTLEGEVDADYISKDDSFLQGTIYDLYRENNSYSQEDISNVDAIFLAESKIIRNLVKNGSCIILGKCSNYVLRENYKTFNVFIAGDKDFRVKNIMKSEKIDEEKANARMNRIDLRRKNHYKKFANGRWGNASDYDLCIEASKYSKENIAEIIIDACKYKINKLSF